MKARMFFALGDIHNELDSTARCLLTESAVLFENAAERLDANIAEGNTHLTATLIEATEMAILIKKALQADLTPTKFTANSNQLLS
jgi:hypothetical protein